MVWYLAGFRSTPLRCEADINEKAFNFMDTSSGCSFERYCRFVSCFVVGRNGQKAVLYLEENILPAKFPRD